MHPAPWFEHYDSEASPLRGTGYKGSNLWALLLSILILSNPRSSPDLDFFLLCLRAGKDQSKTTEEGSHIGQC